MSTAQQYIQDGTLASNKSATGHRGVDPRRRRFALNPGIYMAMLEPRESGRQEILLPNGLVSFRTTMVADDDFDHALKNGHNRTSQPEQTITEVSAAAFLNNAIIRYGEQGMRELSCLTLMDDPEPNQHGNVTKEQFQKSAQGYFAALWPSFADIGYQCPEGLKECVTCRLWLIGDPSEGEAMHEELVERTSKLADQAKVAELRQEIVDSLRAYREWLSAKWAALLGEKEDRKTGAPGIAKFGPGEHHVRRNLHEIEPSEAATASEFGAQVAAANTEATRELAAAFREGKSTDNTDLMKMMIERQNKTDEALESLAKSVKALVDNQSGQS